MLCMCVSAQSGTNHRVNPLIWELTVSDSLGAKSLASAAAAKCTRLRAAGAPRLHRRSMQGSREMHA